jgi:hypothetical protein
VHQVVPEDANGLELTPDTEVVIVNRGALPLTVKWNGRDCIIQPGYNSIAYGIARHAQDKLIVPGSRNVETAAFESFIGIPNVDPPEMCEPFTPEELEKIGQKVEAIDRTGQENDFQVVKTSATRAKIAGQGAVKARRPQSDGNQQFSPQAEEAAKYAMQPPAGGEAARQSAGGVETA